MDDFDRCMEEYPNQKSVYCYTRSQIKPNDSSSLWSLIKVQLNEIIFIY